MDGNGRIEPMDGTATAETVTEADAFEWAIVEVMGHRKHAGRTREEERFGAKMLRVDVPTLVMDPIEEGKPTSYTPTGWTTIWYGGTSLFSYTLTDEASVMRMNRPYSPAQRYIAPPDYDDDDDRPF